MKQHLDARLLGVVLCGGRSSRMGRDKATLRHPGGGTFLSYSLGRLDPLCDEVCIAGSTTAPSTHRVLADSLPFAGPVTGVASALSLAEAEGFAAILITPIDMPSLSSHDLAHLCRTWRMDPQQLVCAVCEPELRIEPLVAVYPTRLRKAIETLTLSEDRSLNRWIANHEHTSVRLPEVCCRNINTPEDFNSGPEVSV